MELLFLCQFLSSSPWYYIDKTKKPSWIQIHFKNTWNSSVCVCLCICTQAPRAIVAPASGILVGEDVVQQHLWQQ